MAKALMGSALLAAIGAQASQTPPYLMITQPQAASLDASHIEVNQEIVEGDKAAAILTDAGRAALSGGTVEPGDETETAAPFGGYEIEDNIPMPIGNRGGRASGYPFDRLEVGQSFHVPKTAENEDPANRVASSVSGARLKYSTPVVDAEGKPVMETVNIKTYKLGADGKLEKDAEGKRIFTGTRPETRQKRLVVRDFNVASVGADDPRGEGARVWRIK